MACKYYGENKTTGRKMLMSAIVPYSLYETVKAYAKKKKVSMSYVIRRCIEIVLLEEEL